MILKRESYSGLILDPIQYLHKPTSKRRFDFCNEFATLTIVEFGYIFTENPVGPFCRPRFSDFFDFLALSQPIPEPGWPREPEFLLESESFNYVGFQSQRGVTCQLCGLVPGVKVIFFIII